MTAVVGYWGCAADKKQEALLTALLATINSTESNLQRFGYPEATTNTNNRPAPVASIACWGRHASLQPANTASNASTASLSAAVIHSPAAADTWVRVERNRLVLGRELFGRVALYWTQHNQVIWFASRLQLLLCVLETPNISVPGLYGYTCLSYVPAPLSPVEHVFAVPAGGEIVWEMNGDLSSGPSSSATGISVSPLLRREHEWREATHQISDEHQAIVQLRKLLTYSIDQQLADLPSGPVGVFLSGGLDSSIVAALLVRAGISVRAYTLDFGEYGFSEVCFAERVANALKIPLVKVQATPRRVRKALTQTVQALDGLFGDGVTVPLFLLNEAARRDTTVVFNGEGGDQLFAGWTNKPLIATSVFRQHEGGDFENPCPSFDDAYRQTFHRLLNLERAVYTPHLLAEVEAVNPAEWLTEALDKSFCSSLLHRLRRANLMLKGAQNIQPRATNLAFAYDLSVRTPFCYGPLADWTFQLSGELLLRGSCEKYLLKRAVENWLPPEIVWREKRGMGVPLTAWCLGPLWREVGAWLNPRVLQIEGRLQSDLALRVALGQLSGHVQGRRIGEVLWLLLTWQAWRRTIFKETFEQPVYNPFWLPLRWWQWRSLQQELC